MENNQKNSVLYHQELENYVPKDLNNNNLVYKKIKRARTLLFFTPIVHIGACVIFLVLLLVDWLVGQKLGFSFTKTEFGLAAGYMALVILVDLLAFMLPAKKAKTKANFRILAIAILILSTLILAGSFIFWMIPVLLFYSLITLILWVFEVYVAVLLINIVETLPN